MKLILTDAVREAYEDDQNNLIPSEVESLALDLVNKQRLKEGKSVGEAGRSKLSKKTWTKLANEIGANPNHTGNRFRILY
jgi:hypothetical protein